MLLGEFLHKILNQFVSVTVTKCSEQSFNPFLPNNHWRAFRLA